MQAHLDLERDFDLRSLGVISMTSSLSSPSSPRRRIFFLLLLFIVDGIILIKVTESLLLLLDSDMMRTSVSSVSVFVELLLTAVLELAPAFGDFGKNALVEGEVSVVGGSANKRQFVVICLCYLT